MQGVALQLQAEQPSFRRMKTTSVRKFKGLESPIVVLTDLEAGAAEPGVLYMAISRAQLRLCVIGLPGLPSPPTVHTNSE